MPEYKVWRVYSNNIPVSTNQTSIIKTVIELYGYMQNRILICFSINIGIFPAPHQNGPLRMRSPRFTPLLIGVPIGRRIRWSTASSWSTQLLQNARNTLDIRKVSLQCDTNFVMDWALDKPSQTISQTELTIARPLTASTRAPSDTHRPAPKHRARQECMPCILCEKCARSAVSISIRNSSCIMWISAS